MAGKRVYAGRRDRSVSRKKYKRRYKRPVYLRSMGLGPKQVVQMAYCEYPLSIDSGVGGTMDEYVFSANGLYDPNISGTGHQPIGFDQMTQFFDHYVVLGSKIRVNYRNNDATYAQIVTLRLSDNSTETADGRLAIENGRSMWKLIGPSGDGISDQCEIEMGCNPAKFLGRKNPLSDPELKGSSSANPSEQAYWMIGCAPETAVDGGSVQLVVHIQYTVAWIEPKLLSIS